MINPCTWFPVFTFCAHTRIQNLLLSVCVRMRLRFCIRCIFIFFDYYCVCLSLFSFWIILDTLQGLEGFIECIK